jgi:fumarylacetoacetase
MINANNPKLTSWIEVGKDSDFPIQNIPFGIGKPNNKSPRPLSRIGDLAIDLSVLSDYGFFDDLNIQNFGVFYAPVLNDFIELGKSVSNAVRNRISEIFKKENAKLRDDEIIRREALVPMDKVEMMMPVEVGDYTDFYSSIEHATNVGVMFRDPDNALLPNWKHIPVGYHGRSSSIVVSGTNIPRPKGQYKLDNEDIPRFGPSRLFDFELEMAFITGKKTSLGDSIPVNNAEDHIFGLVLFCLQEISRNGSMCRWDHFLERILVQLFHPGLLQ